MKRRFWLLGAATLVGVAALVSWHFLRPAGPELASSGVQEGHNWHRDGDRIVAHIRPEDRPDGKPLTAEQMIRQLQIPGLASLAREPEPWRHNMSEKDVARIRAIGEDRRQRVGADIYALKSEFKNERRKLKDPNADRVGRRYGDNRERVREMRREMKARVEELERKGGFDENGMPASSAMPSKDERAAQRGGRGDGSGGGRGDGSGGGGEGGGAGGGGRAGTGGGGGQHQR